MPLKYAGHAPHHIAHGPPQSPRREAALFEVNAPVATRQARLINVVLGHHPEAIAALEGAKDRGSLGHALAAAGRSVDARRVLEALARDARQQYVSPVQLALVHVGLGEHDEALTCLEHAFALRAVDLAVVRVDARFVPIAKHARLNALMERISLAPAGARDTSRE